jgi:putrescine transport system substrate-binding protein
LNNEKATDRAGPVLSLLTLTHAEERTLRVYNWFDYITPTGLEDFKAQNTQTKLVYDIFDTNEALEASC